MKDKINQIKKQTDEGYFKNIDSLYEIVDALQQENEKMKDILNNIKNLVSIHSSDYAREIYFLVDILLTNVEGK